MTMPPTGETGLIAALAECFGTPPPEVILGIGDDCAALDIGGDHYLLWTIDTLVEGVHFDLTYISLTQLGRKSLAVNLSDIAAMGGEPQWALLSLGWPPQRDLAGALELGQGMAEISREYHVRVIGGDTVASPPGITIMITVLGRVPKEGLLTRGGARVGDRILVTGTLGDSAAGLELLRLGLNLEANLKEPLIQAHLNPAPQLAAGHLLARLKLATAAIDLSDGVATDLFHICRASNVGAVLEAEAIPVSPGVEAAARALEVDPLDLALRGGEDYQLLFTTAPDQVPRLSQAFSQADLRPPVEVGKIISGQEVTLLSPKGKQIISGTGYDHFRLDLQPGKD